MTLEHIALLAFTACNCARVFAYLPQMLTAFAAQDGCRSTSCMTWSMFIFANASTTLHAAVNLHDTWMTAIFAGNTLCCVVIVGTILAKRVISRRTVQQNGWFVARHTLT
jgi:hypothetical protein